MELPLNAPLFKTLSPLAQNTLTRETLERFDADPILVWMILGIIDRALVRYPPLRVLAAFRAAVTMAGYSIEGVPNVH